ncbi:hypothetical protein [Basfia succiniciproducens]|uniref:hypothetical protein n=1 Tax=Basfia succiniciproducens TaxID=653940 RepID=UPI0008B112D3|nr:hypothetical protein [Basfia succiniciproducens]SEQ73524.1 hypothetical protein SAMN02910415_01968 [Basfia succiniciproducens]
MMQINDRVILRNGQQGVIAYVSPFGKLLVVEQDPTQEEPKTHWHNTDGSFYADTDSDLDIIDCERVYSDTLTLPIVNVLPSNPRPKTGAHRAPHGAY